jgi:hypothetical protein
MDPERASMMDNDRNRTETGARESAAGENLRPNLSHRRWTSRKSHPRLVSFSRSAVLKRPSGS